MSTQERERGLQPDTASGPARQTAPGTEPDGQTAATLQRIGRAATVALYDELALAPKPGLVSFVDSGSHRDMDARSFMRSLFALRHYFVQITGLGYAEARFSALQDCGQAAERRMLAATGGINTHRGAVFTLGLLCASAGAVVRDRDALRPSALRAALQRDWGSALDARRSRPTGLPGDTAARRHGLRSAAQEAAAGFPTLFDHVLPRLVDGLRRGISHDAARTDALFAAMATLDDTNLAHRGGIAGLRQVQAAARSFLADGGAARPGGVAAAWELHRCFVAHGLSPGGAADMLAAACWVVRICPATAGRPWPAATVAPTSVP